jgi:2-polyprenyl-6-methoxyphenol hydroxylase-like FAD-dependent oxidoreductase
MKIVIIGAGIAGCAAYLELRKHLPPPSDSEVDHEIIIYEAYSTDVHVTSKERERKQEDNTHSSTLLVGGGLGIAANGLNVLRRLDEDLMKDVVRSGYAASTFNMKSKNGWPLVSMDATGHTSSEKQRMHMIAASRHSFWQALRSRIPGEHIINKRVLEVIAKPDGKNVIHFVDGSPSVETDLVIGADGVRSTVKRAIFADAKEDPYPPNYESVATLKSPFEINILIDLVLLGVL